MFRVQTFKRNKDGNRGDLIGSHYYNTQKQAQRAANVMKRLSSSRHLIPIFSDRQNQKYKLCLSKHNGYIVSNVEEVEY